MKNIKNIHFIHANGYPPGAYSSLFSKINKSYKVNYFNLFSDKIDIKNLKNWEQFHKNFTKELSSRSKTIGIGHSIGGNLILRSAISHPEKFSKIVLLDPTLFTPKIIFFWKFIRLLGLDDSLHPLSKKTLNRKMIYEDYDSMYKSYRKKSIFKYINDKNLNIYIKSITKQNKDKTIKITFPKEWEYKIYKTGIVEDNYIWRNIKNINIPTLILRANESNTFFKSAENKINKIKNNNIKIISINECSHLFPIEIPEQVYQKIANFLNQ